MAKGWKNILKTIFFLLIGVSLLIWAFQGMNMQEVLTQIRQAHFGWVLAAIACGVLSHLSRAMRWQLLMEPLGYKIRLSNSFYAVMSGYLMNFIVPRMGEVSRCAVIVRTEQAPFDKTIGTVVIERLVDLFMLMVLTVLIVVAQYDLLQDFIQTWILPSDGKNAWLLWALPMVAVVFLGLAWGLWRMRDRFMNTPLLQKLRLFAEGVLEGLQTIARLRQKGWFIFHSIFIWVMYFCMSWLVFYALDSTAHLGISAGLTALFAGTVAIVIPVPGGIGTYHTLVSAGLAIYGISDQDGTIYATLSHASQMLMIFGVGGFSLLALAWNERSKTKEA